MKILKSHVMWLIGVITFNLFHPRGDRQSHMDLESVTLAPNGGATISAGAAPIKGRANVTLPALQVHATGTVTPPAF
jgi:hypothetical protein